MNLKKVITKSIRENLAPGNSVSAITGEEQRDVRKTSSIRWSKRAAALAFAAVLLLTATIFAVATGSNKLATLTLEGDDTAVVGDTVNVDVVAAFPDTSAFNKGVVGLTAYISYNNTALGFTEIEHNLSSDDFVVTTNAYTDGATAGVAVLVYPVDKDNDGLLKAVVAENKTLFTLKFSAASAGACEFAFLDGTNLADYTNDDDSFELLALTKNDTHAVTVSAASTTYNITVNKSEGGTVTAPATIAEGGSVDITLKPDDNYFISAITVDGTDVLANLEDYSSQSLEKEHTYVLTDVTDDTTINVTFSVILNQWNGAAIRLSNAAERAMRFTTEVADAYLAHLGAIGANYEVGTLVLPWNLATGNSLEYDKDNAKAIVTLNWQPKDVVVPEDAAYTAMTSVLTKVPVTREIAGRAYIKVGNDLIYAGFTAANNVRTMKEIAIAVKADTALYNSYSTELQDVIDTIALGQ